MVWGAQRGHRCSLEVCPISRTVKQQRCLSRSPVPGTQQQGPPPPAPGMRRKDPTILDQTLDRQTNTHAAAESLNNGNGTTSHTATSHTAPPPPIPMLQQSHEEGSRVLGGHVPVTPQVGQHKQDQALRSGAVAVLAHPALDPVGWCAGGRLWWAAHRKVHTAAAGSVWQDSPAASDVGVQMVTPDHTVARPAWSHHPALTQSHTTNNTCTTPPPSFTHPHPHAHNTPPTCHSRQWPGRAAGSAAA